MRSRYRTLYVVDVASMGDFTRQAFDRSTALFYGGNSYGEFDTCHKLPFSSRALMHCPKRAPGRPETATPLIEVESARRADSARPLA